MRSPTAVRGRYLRLGFGLALLGALVAVAGPEALGRTLLAVEPGGLLAALALYAVMVGVKTARWLRVVRLQGLSLPWRRALKAYGLGMLLGAVTPGRVGLHVRAVVLLGRGASWAQALAGTVVDQLLDLVVMAALVPVAVGYFGVRVTGSFSLGVLSLALAVAGVGLLARLGRDRFGSAAAEAWRLGRRALGGPLLLACASTGLYLLTLACVARAVGIRAEAEAVVLASVASAVVELAPVTVAGLGTREAALLALLGPLGAEAPSVLAFTLLVRSFQIALGAAALACGTGPVGAGVRGAETADGRTL